MGPYELASFGSDPSSPLNSSDIEGLLNDCSATSSDLAPLVRTLIPELNSPPVIPGLGPNQAHCYVGPNPSKVMATGDVWVDPIVDNQPAWRPSQQQLLTVVNDVEEDSGIRLVHALLTCAEAIQCGELSVAASLIKEMTNELLTRVNTTCGIGKVAGYFVEALSCRLCQPGQVPGPSGYGLGLGLGLEYEVVYHHFYEACPYLKFAHFTANQAILEAFEGHDHVHVIDFSLMQGLQWPALIQALALRPGGPPTLRLTGIGPLSENGPDSLRLIGLKLAELAKSVNMRFAFRAVVTSQLEDIKPLLLDISPKEALAVNSILQLHRFLGSSIDPVLEWIRSLSPKIVTLVKQEANHNQPEFLTRFTEALYYYSTMFDSLEACQLQPDKKALAEIYMQREISNIVCCEGPTRVERHEPLAKWQARMSRAGFEPLDLGQNAFRQASMLLTMFSAQGYCVQERQGCLTLGWHSRPLIATSAWKVGPITDTRVNHDRSTSSSSSS